MDAESCSQEPQQLSFLVSHVGALFSPGRILILCCKTSPTPIKRLMLLLICKCSIHGKEGNLLGGSYVPPPEAKYDQLEQCFLESPALGLSHPHGAVDWKGV